MGSTILVCTADLIAGSSYARLIASEGHTVETALNGQDLISRLDKLSYAVSLIVCDVRLPGLHNFDLGDFISMKTLDRIPIIGIADLARDEEFLMNASEGFTVILQKGFSARELIDAVHSALSVDYHVGFGMSEQNIRERTEKLRDPQHVDSEFGEFLQNFGQNRSRNSMMDQIRKDE